jgi:glycosyltransferase involved in cell wall biosynthesis
VNPNGDSLPLVSVIAISYEHERFVLDCLESIRAQTYPNVQLIVVDDCSTDGTVSVIESWLAQTGTPCTLVTHDRNLGICSTKNDALRHARGVYVAGVSTDDVWLPDKLARQVECMEAAPETVAVVYSDAERTDESGRALPTTFLEEFDRSERPPSGDIYETLLERNFIPAGSALIRRACLEQVGPYDETLAYEDWDMWLRLARQYEFVCLPGVTLRYRVHEASLSHALSRHDRGALQAETEMKILLKHLGYTPRWDAVLWDRIARIAYRLGRPEQLDFARAWLRSSLNPRALVLYALCRLHIPHRLVKRLVPRRRYSPPSS